MRLDLRRYRLEIFLLVSFSWLAGCQNVQPLNNNSLPTITPQPTSFEKFPYPQPSPLVEILIYPLPYPIPTYTQMAYPFPETSSQITRIAPTLANTATMTSIPEHIAKQTQDAKATEEIIAQKCPVNPEQKSYLQPDDMVVKPASRDGWCEVTLLRTIEYSLTYPEGWIVTLAGVERMNLRFDTQGLFVQVIKTTLPLEQADQATYSYEMPPAEPLVDPDENQISKSMQMVGNYQSLVLLTTKDNITIKRYFILNNYTLCMFQIKIPTDKIETVDTKELISDVEQMIKTIQFGDY